MVNSNSCCSKLYYVLTLVGRFLQPFLLLALRLFWGYQFFLAGIGKLSNIESTIKLFSDLHILWPTFNAYFVGCVEVVAGLMLLVGFGARLAAIPLIVIMVFAYLTAHHEALANAVQDPYEVVKQTPFNFLLTSLIVFCFGPGCFSLDAILKRCSGRSKCCSHSCSIHKKTEAELQKKEEPSPPKEEPSIPPPPEINA